ncbi:hypothetical protein OG948_49860 (plasmid) [Embleya sp. NBC_00888]|uniref:hypothetical protein n=1 Tax=Embleya sp. NBC_00888 TaxID=2975960 RepID=UPI002F91AD32|nr:hypothetical protein OG948_49860 [Embleya sp. NBC_00888]
MSSGSEYIDPMNLSAQLRYQAVGNPPSTLPDSASSNSAPGLEFDIRNLWRRLFEGIELHEADNYVTGADAEHRELIGHRLLKVAGAPVITSLIGPQRPGAKPTLLTTGANPDGVTMLEWSNSLADVLDRHAGSPVECVFTAAEAPNPVGLPADPIDPSRVKIVFLTVRPLFAKHPESGARLPVIEESMVEPGELTWGLCSPWQNDYRECACYYWAASRPDYVNVEEDERGVSTGNHWFALRREPREYVLDDRDDSRLLSYTDLFRDWQGTLRFIVGGNDYEPR